MKTVVTFESDLFNLIEPKDYFINPCCFGDDLARWLIEKFKGENISVDEEIGQEDFGWYFDFLCENQSHCIVIGNIASEKWFLVIERNCSLLATLFGGRNRQISKTAIELLDRVLRGESEITNVVWHDRKTF
jgi:hypothetical protein